MICERGDAAYTSDWNSTDTQVHDRETGHFEHMFDEAKLEEGRMGEIMLALLLSNKHTFSIPLSLSLPLSHLKTIVAYKKESFFFFLKIWASEISF